MAPKLFSAGFLVVLLIENIHCSCPDSGTSSTSPTPATSPTSTNNPTPATNLTPPTDSNPTYGPPAAAIIPAECYPNAKRDESVQDTYSGGVTVKDPYRWLENPDCPETKKFIEEEMAITKPYLEKSPFRVELQARYKELYDYPKYWGPFQKGKYFFTFRNTGLQNHDVLYISDTMTGEGKVFFDVNTLSEDGSVSLGANSFTDDGKLFAYALGTGGSDWRTVHFKDVEKGTDFKDKLEKVKFSDLQWSKDNKGVFYSAFRDQKGKTDGSENEANKNHKLYYHVVGTEQCEDILIAEFPENPDYYVGSTVSDCGKYLIVSVSAGCENNLVYVADISNGITAKPELKPIITKMEANYGFVANNGSQFIFQTNKDADNYKLIVIDITNPDPAAWKDLVPEHEKNTMEWASAAHDKYLILSYIEDVKIINEVKLKNFDREKFTVEQVFFQSKDGTKIPMYIAYKKGLKRDGNNFAFLHSYGGFACSSLPYFAINRLVIMSNFDGVHCVANIRGGGEYGEKWHKDGSLEKKQNCFDDFQAAAEYLITEQYTNSKLLAINGGSNGGLLMGACLNQRPDLFGAVVADVGVMDMLRFDKFTCGHAWITEYGSSSDPKFFPILYKYSPLHNIKIPEGCDKQYPATMLTTSDHDDRVSPLHSLKFIAALQYEAKKRTNQKNPFIIRVETDAGHGCGKPLDKEIAELVDMMCFFVINLGIKFKAFLC